MKKKLKKISNRKFKNTSLQAENKQLQKENK
jgi:hypothetical protein